MIILNSYPGQLSQKLLSKGGHALKEEIENHSNYLLVLHIICYFIYTEKENIHVYDFVDTKCSIYLTML